MARLIVILLLFIGLMLIIGAVVSTVSRVGQEMAGPQTGGGTMPKSLSKIAYILLLIIMFGAAGGMLGGM